MLEEWETPSWRVAMIAHDAKKGDLVAFAQRHLQQFRHWNLVATNLASAECVVQALAFDHENVTRP